MAGISQATHFNGTTKYAGLMWSERGVLREFHLMSIACASSGVVSCVVASGVPSTQSCQFLLS